MQATHSEDAQGMCSGGEPDFRVSVHVSQAVETGASKAACPPWKTFLLANLAGKATSLAVPCMNSRCARDELHGGAHVTTSR